MTMLFENTRPNIQAFLDFSEGSLFGPECCERIVCTSHLEAIEGMLDESNLQYTEDVEAWLTTQEQFWVIAAYKPDTCTKGQISDWALNATETLREFFGEEYGDEEGDDHLSDDDIAELNRRSQDLVEWYVSRAKVWRCEQLRTFTFDSADVLEMVRQLRPDWLKKKSERDV